MASYRHNHYHVEIRFTKPSSLHGRYSVGYTGSVTYTDTFVFLKNKINLVLSRTREIADGNILATNNTIATQIIKAVLCYYAASTGFPKITNVAIVLKRAGRPDVVYGETAGFLQPITATADARNLTFAPSIAGILLDTSEKAGALRIAMSYWLKAISSNDIYYRFDHLWRAFNRVYMHQGAPQTKENECMRIMRAYMTGHAHLFPESIAITNAYTTAVLHGFRWNRMIINNHDTQKKAGALADFIERYKDHRVMALMKQKIICRQTHLENINRWNEVNNHIDTHIARATTSDIELVALMTLKYAYFVRNKLFHGEVAEGTFKLKRDNIDMEVQRLDELLEMLLFEIMSNHASLR